MPITKDGTCGKSIQLWSFVVLLTTLALGVLLAHQECRSTDSLPYSLDTSLRRSDWPVFFGPCFLFQAPEELDVRLIYAKQHPYDRIMMYSLDGKLLLSLLAHNNQPVSRPEAATELNVGGLTYWHEEENNEEGYSGVFYLYTPLFYPRFINASYLNLTRAERELVREVFSSIRINKIFEVGFGSDTQRDHVLSPKWDVEPILPEIDGPGECTLSRYY